MPPIDTEQSGQDQAGSEQPSGSGLASAISSAFDELGLNDLPAAEKPATVKKQATEEEPIAEGEEPAGEEEAEPGKQEEEPAPQPAPKLAAPAQWDAASKAKFDKLPDSAKSIVLDLAKNQERDYTRKTTELAGDRRFAQSIRQLITDEHREQLAEAGLDEVTGIARLLEYQDFALAQPRNYVRWFAQAANLRPQDIFPEAFAGVRPAQGQQPQPGGQRPPGQQPPTNGAADPNITQLRGAVDSITSWIQGQQREEQRRVREQEASVQRQAISVIGRFRAAVGEDGEALYPYFGQVEDAMTEILNGNPTKYNAIEDPMERLKAAYEAAVAWDPELRKQQIALEAARKNAAARKRADVDKAKAAKPPVTTTPASGEPKGGKRSLKDFVSDAMSEVGVT